MKAPAARIDCDDLLSRRGSELLADAINIYWRERGYTVNAESYLMTGTKAWGVRSDLVAGLPRKPQGKSIADRREEFLR